jgi:hypothetical protein
MPLGAATIGECGSNSLPPTPAAPLKPMEAQKPVEPDLSAIAMGVDSEEGVGRP